VPQRTSRRTWSRRRSISLYAPRTYISCSGMVRRPRGRSGWVPLRVRSRPGDVRCSCASGGLPSISARASLDISAFGFVVRPALRGGVGDGARRGTRGALPVSPDVLSFASARGPPGVARSGRVTSARFDCDLPAVLVDDCAAGGPASGTPCGFWLADAFLESPCLVAGGSGRGLTGAVPERFTEADVRRSTASCGAGPTRSVDVPLAAGRVAVALRGADVSAADAPIDGVPMRTVSLETWRGNSRCIQSVRAVAKRVG
jgi:hypothetical protein